MNRRLFLLAQDQISVSHRHPSTKALHNKNPETYYVETKEQFHDDYPIIYNILNLLGTSIRPRTTYPKDQL